MRIIHISHAIYVSLLLGLSAILFSVSALATPPDNTFYPKQDTDYLPQNITYNNAISTPEVVLGNVVGKWHVRHDQLVNYMKTVSAQSNRVQLEVIGHTHEHRELTLLTISHPDNLARIEDIKQAHINNVKNGKRADDEAPVILYMGYSIHGNEPSGANAALLIAYYLAAGQGEAVDELLKNTVILLDPAMNPDGLARFAQWTNMHNGQHPSASRFHREHRERFPSGRTNHYWFDLNRDWLLLTHPESQARIAQFHQWRPHVLTDFHEMGTNSTYFFQPGVPSRTNPLTDAKNIQLTNVLATHHADALDGQGQLYFTKERFDDFYHGKGSTYPDAHGTVGILFEQASSRGAVQESINGTLNFAQSIKNQVTTTLSTFAGALANKDALLAYPYSFYRDTQQLIDADEVGAYVIALSDDHSRNQALLNLLQSHQIDVALLDEDFTGESSTGHTLEISAGEGLVVKTDQLQYRLLTGLFSTQQSFANNTFYDVSNWNIAKAYNLAYANVAVAQAKRLDTKPVAQLQKSLQRNIASDIASDIPNNAVALAFQWTDSHAPRLLQRLLSADINVRIANLAFSAQTSAGEVQFSPGTVVIPAGQNATGVLADVIEHAQALNVDIASIQSGLALSGIDLGSGNMTPLTLPNVAIVTGVGVSQYDVGAIWHYFDTRVGLPITMLDQDRISSADLDEFTHIIVVSGRYPSLLRQRDALTEWVKQGGTLIAQRTGLRFLAQIDMLKGTLKNRQAVRDAVAMPDMRYADRGKFNALQQVAGSVHNAQVDASHPLMWGMDIKHAQLALFKTSNIVVHADDTPFVEVASYMPSPLLAGYTAPEVEALIAESSAIIAHRQGRGRVIALTDSVNFRGYWRGTEKIMANAVYFSKMFD